jgi:hypothetical protein
VKKPGGKSLPLRPETVYKALGLPGDVAKETEAQHCNGATCVDTEGTWTESLSSYPDRSDNSPRKEFSPKMVNGLQNKNDCRYFQKSAAAIVSIQQRAINKA